MGGVGSWKPVVVPVSAEDVVLGGKGVRTWEASWRGLRGQKMLSTAFITEGTQHSSASSLEQIIRATGTHSHQGRIRTGLYLPGLSRETELRA